MTAAKSYVDCSGAAIGNESVKVPYQTVVENRPTNAPGVSMPAVSSFHPTNHVNAAPPPFNPTNPNSQIQYVFVQPAGNNNAQYAPYQPPQSNNANNHFNPNRLNASELHRLKCNLLNGLGEPFSGKPEDYALWKNQLEKWILKCEADSADTLQIIMANTLDPVKSSVKRYLAASSSDDITLKMVWDMLHDRYGSNEFLMRF